MAEPMAGCARACPGTYCDRCDLLVGLPGLRVIAVERDDRRLTVMVESPPTVAGCRSCGVVSVSHGRRDHVLVDAPAFGRPVRVVWRKRTWRCAEATCGGGAFTEQDADIAAPRGLLTVVGGAPDPR